MWRILSWFSELICHSTDKLLAITHNFISISIKTLNEQILNITKLQTTQDICTDQNLEIEIKGVLVIFGIWYGWTD